MLDGALAWLIWTMMDSPISSWPQAVSIPKSKRKFPRTRFALHAWCFGTWVMARRLHFGLGPESAGDLTIRWTSGKIEMISNVAANQLVVIREGAGIIRTQKF